MKTIYDIQQLLKRFGTIIYIGDRVADLELLEMELKELYQSQLIEPREFQSALLILRHEIQLQKEKLQSKDR
ncbi:YqgQ family protein [Neobacillus drentensis]|uniref:YqgQ family protein n=1 Tax=Neobacillus drentensis TaxID=220684 RepID=UPI003002F136